MPITVKCECGKTLKVDDKHRGKKAKCPACGGILLVEESGAGDADTGMQAEAPKKSRAGDDDQGAVKSGAPKKRAAADDDAGDDPDDRAPAKRPAKSNKMMYMIGGGCAFLLISMCCLGIVGTGVWYFFFRGTPDDLIYVHEGTAGFVTVRVADVWKSTVVQDQLKKMPANAKKEMDDKLKEMETKGGLRIEDFERMTIVFRSLDNLGPGGKDMAFVIKTSKAMNPKKIVEAMAKEKNIKEKEVKHEGMTIWVLDGGFDTMAITFPSDRIMLMAPSEVTLKDVLKQAKKPAKNAALVRGIQLASSSKHAFVVAFEAPKKLMDQPGAAAAWQQAPTMKDMTGVFLTGTLSKDLALEAIITFPSADKAGKAKKEVEDGITTIKGLINMGGAKMPPAADKFMKSIKVEQRSAEVAITATVELNLDDLGPANPFFGGFGAGPGGVQKVKEAGTRNMHVNNMKQIGLAMHSFHDNHKALPNHAIRHPKTGQPLLSWRVAVLPYIDEVNLYTQIKLDEPWDSAHNRQFWNRMPRAYQAPNRPNDGRTHLQVFHGDQSAFPRAMKNPPAMNLQGEVRMTGITDGTSNTIVFVESATLVNWMQPEDIPFTMGDPTLNGRVGNYWGDGSFLAALGDGTVRTFRRPITSQNLQAFITRNGGEVVNLP